MKTYRKDLPYDTIYEKLISKRWIMPLDYTFEHIDKAILRMIEKGFDMFQIIIDQDNTVRFGSDILIHLIYFMENDIKLLNKKEMLTVNNHTLNIIFVEGENDE